MISGMIDSTEILKPAESEIWIIRVNSNFSDHNKKKKYTFMYLSYQTQLNYTLL